MLKQSALDWNHQSFKTTSRIHNSIDQYFEYHFVIKYAREYQCVFSHKIWKYIQEEYFLSTNGQVEKYKFSLVSYKMKKMLRICCSDSLMKIKDQIKPEKFQQCFSNVKYSLFEYISRSTVARIEAHSSR
jgi:hypothetical protein